MSTRNPSTLTDADHHAALIASAKARARTLRREAVPALWNGLEAWCHDGLRNGQRAAERLARRLRQRALNKAA